MVGSETVQPEACNRALECTVTLTTKEHTMHHHNYIPPIEPAESKLEGIIITVSCIACFAFVGVLLSYGV
jgi:hypothetical protein